jgi:hypothetical protein
VRNKAFLFNIEIYFYQESLLQFSNPNVLADNLRSLRQTFFVDDLDVTLSEEKDVNQLAQEVVHLLNKQLHGKNYRSDNVNTKITFRVYF